jgi:hypothetical protein
MAEKKVLRLTAAQLETGFADAEQTVQFGCGGQGIDGDGADTGGERGAEA